MVSTLIIKNEWTLFRMSKFFLMLLIFSININGANFFHTKEVFFFLLLISGFAFVDYNRLKPFLLMMIVFFSSLFFNLTISGSNVDYFYGVYFSLGFLYLFLLVFDNCRYRRVIIDSYLFSAKVVAAFIVLVWFVCFFFNDIKWALINFFGNIDNDNVAFIFMIRSRKILDWWLPGVYYATAPCLIPALCFYLFKSIRNNHNSNKSACWLISLALFFTAARANMLAVIVLVFVYLIFISYRRKMIILSFLLATVALVSVLSMLLFLLNDVNESSLAIKTLHKVSYMHEFGSDEFRTLFFGWGAGSSFFTLGFNEVTMLTELTLYETVRRYGLFSTVLILFFIWFPPIIKSFYLDLSVIFLGLGLLVYILVASTNPFLLGSIGFCALLFFSSVINCLVENRQIDI